MKIKKIDFNFRAKINPLIERLGSHIRSPYFKDTITQLFILPTLALSLASWIFSLYFFKVTKYLVPLRYSSFLGFSRIGKWYESYELVIFMTICVLINLFLANVVYKKDKFLAHIITASNIFITLVVITMIINFGRIINQ
ncbi:MAG: hypothetical protein PHT36_01900 [Patescibacteria group bacterium]|nr:hypothetical protein [Patescibacteria group bacterium]